MRMTHTLKLARRAARFRAPMLITFLALTFAACDNADKLTNTIGAEATNPTVVANTPTAEMSLEDSLAVEDSLAMANGDPTGGQPTEDDDGFGIGEEEDGVVAEVVAGPDPVVGLAAASLASAVYARRGIPFGPFHLPQAKFGGTYNGSVTNVAPSALLRYLAQAKRTGARVILSFSGTNRFYQNSNHTFSLTKWQQRVNRYRGIRFASYIKDGTLIGHYLMDEPHHAANWGGRLVSRATLDAMARYSKKLWPGLATVVRSPPSYLRGYHYRYLDAAWAQYTARFGSVSSYVSANVRDARASGLALVVGMNTLAGSNGSGLRGYYGKKGWTSMTAGQIRSWGAAILANPYPCAFLNWRWDDRYMGRADVKLALAYLSGKARLKSAKSCRGS